MMNSKQELAVTQNVKSGMANLTSFKSISQLEDHCQKMIDSGYLPQAVRTPAQALVIAQMGAELGLPMMTAFNNINVIQGKPVLGWRGQTALVQKFGVVIDVVRNYDPKLNQKGDFTGNYETEIRVIRKYDSLDGRVIEHTFSKSWNECVLAGWTTKDNWKKYPKNMLKARAITDALALYCSDMLNGIYSLEEMADSMDINVVSTEEGEYQLVDENGEVTSVIETAKVDISK